MSAKADPRDRLKKLREAYGRQLPDKARQTAGLIAQLASDRTNADLLKETHRSAHTLVGSSASFGFTAFSAVVRKLEELLKEALAKGGLDDKTLGLINEAIKLVLAASEQAEQISDKDTREPLLGRPATEADSKVNRTIFVVEDDPMLLENISIMIKHFGYDVSCFRTTSELIAAVRKTTPAAIIADIVFPEGQMAGIDAVSSLRAGDGASVPIIFISMRDDLPTRIRAVRAGGNAYFVKPFTIASLIDKLDSLTSGIDTGEPYRVLIVDDDADLAEYHALMLREAGMTTQVVTEAMSVTGPLYEFNPDLILMDLYMPECTGLELAAAIRQIERFVSIPIVFLSGEMNIDKQLTAMRTGGDDFLTKPIEPDHLISSVRIRAERMRIIRSFMDRDGLTNLLNHTKTKEGLDLSLERGRRNTKPLSFAMIDIDHFKKVNDTYGHPVGDRVIKSLARLLQQRLRKTDLIGRYGGEEFAVVLHETDKDTALRILDAIRESFSQIKHTSEGLEFSATFSCGIASYPDFSDAVQITKAADDALYIAKQGGRNCCKTAVN